MSMFVWADGTVTGSVDVVELEAIQKALKPLSKTRQADLEWPIESAAQLADQLASDDDPESKPHKAAKASESKAKADPKAAAEAEAGAEAMSKVDLPAALAKSTKKEG